MVRGGRVLEMGQQPLNLGQVQLAEFASLCPNTWAAIRSGKGEHIGWILLTVMGKLTSGKEMKRAVARSKVAQALEQFALVHESWSH